MEKKYSRKNVFNNAGRLLPAEERTFVTQEGYLCTVIDGGTKVNFVTAQISRYVFEAQMSKVRAGFVKNPYHKSVFGNGFFGIGAYASNTHRKAYQTWCGILERVYSVKYQSRFPTYVGTTLESSWLNFQIFAEWFEESNYRKSWHIDKDLLASGKKHYGPDTCIFIPKELNAFLANKYKSNTSGYTGVCWRQGRKRYVVRIKSVTTNKSLHLGYYRDLDSANAMYVQARKEQASVWKIKMLGVLPDKAVEQIK